eukprot:m.166461 g.166461  ORF g.166461 m.166461 type:complete len:63 (+) comp17171_c0_seq2:74-262(+)
MQISCLFYRRDELLTIGRPEIISAMGHPHMKHAGATVVVGSSGEAKNFEGRSDWEVASTADL